MVEPTIYEWFAEIIIPLITGIGLLVLSIVAAILSFQSNRISKRALQLAKESEKEIRETRARDLKFSICEDLLLWSSKRWNGERTLEVQTLAECQSLKSLWSVRMTESKIEGSKELQNFLWSIEQHVPNNLESIGSVYYSGAMARIIDEAIACWLKQPEKLPMKIHEIQKHIETLGARAMEKDKEYTQELELKIRNGSSEGSKKFP